MSQVLRGDERILVVRTDRVGDLILTTPLIEMIKTRYPDIRVDMLVSPYAKDVIWGNPYISEIVLLTGDYKLLLPYIRSIKYDWGLAIRPTLPISLLLYRGKVANRVGTSRRAYSPLFNHRINLKRRGSKTHEAVLNARLLLPLEITGEIPPARIYLSERDHDEAAALAEKNGLDIAAPFVIVHPGSFGSSPNIPLSRYLELADVLASDYSMQVVLTGNEAERDALVATGRTFGGKILSLAGLTSLRGMCALVSKAKGVLVSSTGVLHIAAAFDVPTVGFFSPIPQLSPSRWGAWGPAALHRVIVPDPAFCGGPCEGKCPPDGCMNTITVEMVRPAVEGMLSPLPALSQRERV